MGIAINLLKAPHIGIRDLKERFSHFLKRKDSIVVTDRGEPTKVLVPYEELVELLDIIEEMQDGQARSLVAEGRQAIQSGAKGIPVIDIFQKIRSKKS